MTANKNGVFGWDRIVAQNLLDANGQVAYFVDQRRNARHACGSCRVAWKNTLQYRTLGSTGIEVSRLAFGAGPVAAVMIGEDARRQRELVRHTLDQGVNWFDTAAGYGDGRAEQNLGRALNRLDAAGAVHLATKVRLTDDPLCDVPAYVRASVEASRQRLQTPRLTLLQLHNAITQNRGDEPASITPQDVLGPGGAWEAFDRLRQEGAVRCLGITALGQVGPLKEVIESGRFDTIQTPYNLVNPTAGMAAPTGFAEVDYGNVIQTAADKGMGVFAIRTYAGGALANREASLHTLRTRFFTRDLYQRDLARAARLQKRLPANLTLKEAAVRFTLSHPDITAAIIGFSEALHADEAIGYLNGGPLDSHLVTRLQNALFSEPHGDEDA